MSTAPKILALREIDPPALLAEALTPEFLRPLRIENLPAVRIARRPAGATWGGFCVGQEYAEHEEVVLQDPAAPRESWLVKEGIQYTYLHEITHRFLCGYDEQKIGGDHGPVFFSLQLLLFLRAGVREEGGRRPWFLLAGVYDLQDAWLAGDYTPGQALDWAGGVAEDLTPTEISAEAAANEIVTRFAAWRRAMATAPARRSAAQARGEAKEKELARLKNKLFGTRIFLAISFFFSLLLIFGWGFWVG